MDLIYFDVPINSPYKDFSSSKSNGSTKDSQRSAERRSISKVICRLEESRHVCFSVKVVDGVNINIGCCRGCSAKADPMPSAKTRRNGLVSQGYHRIEGNR